MTKEEMQTEYERAFTERSELTKKADCLRFRLRTYGTAYAKLAEEPFEGELRERVKNAPDLAADWKSLSYALERIGDLNRLLD